MTEYTPELRKAEPSNPDTVLGYDALGNPEFTLKSALSGAGTLLNIQTFTSNGVYNSTPGTENIMVICTGGGAGDGGNGGTSSFGAFCSASGGINSSAGPTAGDGGSGSGGIINIRGGHGASIAGDPTGGGSFWGAGVGGNSTDMPYGSGANGSSAGVGTPGGGGGGTSIDFITSGFDGTSVTVGAGGASGGGGTGAPGIVVVFEYGSTGSGTGSGGPGVLLGTATASASGQIAFVDGQNGVVFDNTYSKYVIEWNEVKSTEDDVTLRSQVTIDGGPTPTWSAGAGDYEDGGLIATTTALNQQGADTRAHIYLGTQIGTAQGEASNGEIEIYNPSTTDWTKFYVRNSSLNSGNAAALYTGSSNTRFTNPVLGIRFYLSSGTIASGTFRLFGVY